MRRTILPIRHPPSNIGTPPCYNHVDLGRKSKSYLLIDFIASFHYMLFVARDARVYVVLLILKKNTCTCMCVICYAFMI